MKRILQAGFLAVVTGLLAAAPVAAAPAIYPLPLSNLSSITTSNGLWQSITNGSNYYRAYASNTSNDFRRFRGTFTPSSASTKLALHSDDGSWIKINSQTALDFYGENTHFQSASALRLVPYTFTANQPYCVEIYYTNNQHTAGDLDGVTLYAYDGGGAAVDGLPLLGPDFICKGGTGFFQTTCDFGSYTWSSSSPSVAGGSSTTPFIDISGLAAGTTTLTVTDDATGKSGSKTIKVIQLGFTPTSGVVCVGFPVSFVITNAEVTNGVTWSPVQSTAGHPRTNTLTFTNGATNTIIASWSGCSQSATGKVVSVAVTSLTASTNNLCGGGSVTYLATTTPPGFEYLVGWGGEFLGSGGTQTVTYTTPGIKSVNATCNGNGLGVDVTVHKVDITNMLEYALVGGSAAPFNLSADSVGPFTWSVTPSGPTVNGSGGSVTVSAGSTPGTFTVKASATPLPSCNDTSTLQVVQVTFSAGNLAFCEGTNATVALTVTPTNFLSSLTFDTVTNTTSGGTNTHAHLTVSGTNLTVYGDVAGTAYLRAKLGNSIFIGPTLQIVRITFPTNAWYVGVGKSLTNTVTIIPTNASVTFDTVSNSIATAETVAGGVKLTGVAPGTTQVRAKVGGGGACATKEVTAVSVVFPTNALTICNLNTSFVAVVVAPSGAPVTFSSTATNVVQVTAQGTNLTIAPQTNGKATVKAKIGSMEFASMLVVSGTIGFPANDWFALRGTPQDFSFTNSPELSAAEITFTVANSNIATLAAGPPSHLIVTGLTNGTTQITASLEPGQFCIAKTVTIFSAQLQSIEFTSDHNLICNGSSVLNAGTRYPNVEWNPTTGVNAPMTHTAGVTNRVSITVQLAVNGLPNSTTMTLFGNSTEPALIFNSTNSFSGSGTNSLSFQGFSPLGKEIRQINTNIEWNLSVAGNNLQMGISGPHSIFTTVGTPLTTAPSSASIPNVPRMKIATPRLAAAIAAAGSASDAYTCYPRIVKEVMQNAGKYALLGLSLEDAEAWQFPERAPRDCLSIARFVRNVCMTEGVPGAFASKFYAGMYKTTDAYRQTDAGESAYAGQNPLIGTSRPMTAIEGDLCYPSPITKDSYGPTVTPGIDPAWQLRLIDSDCVNLLDPAAAPGTVGCGPGGMNCFEAALLYTEAGGNRTWYMAAGTTPVGVWFEDNTTSAPNQDRHGRDNILRVFVCLAWCAFEDPPGPQPPGLYIKKVEYIYTPATSDSVCP